MSAYQPLTALSEGIVNILSGLTAISGEKRFKTILSVCATTQEKVIEKASNIAGFPAAIIVIGPGSYDDQYSRIVTPGIVILDLFGAKASETIERITGTLDAVLDVFSDGGRSGGVEIEGTSLSVSGFRPLELESRHSAYLVELSALQPKLDLI